MKIIECFDIKSGKGEYTEEYIEKRNGQYPVISGQTVENGVIGYIDKYDYNINECLTYTKDGEKSGTIFLRSGKFNLTSHVNALIVKEKYKDKIMLEWFKYKYEPLFIKTVIGRFGVPSLPQNVLKLIDVDIPDKKIQLVELKAYKSIQHKIVLVKNKICEIESILTDLRHTVVTIPKKEIIEEVRGDELFNILPKNSGITEKFIYDNYNLSKEQLPVFNGSDEIWGFLPRNIKLKNKPIKICKGNIIIIVRKGYAGKIFIQNKYNECIIAEDAIPVIFKKKYSSKIDVNWFIREYQLFFIKNSTGKFSSATFSQEILKKMKFKIPSKSFQKKCSDYYLKLDKKIIFAIKEINKIKSELQKTQNLIIE